ncbi:hypothetical protein QYF36_002066 [Acer negundo]|nr:hypothetical protein QYF36_002066 [Acer negundo]
MLVEVRKKLQVTNATYKAAADKKRRFKEFKEELKISSAFNVSDLHEYFPPDAAAVCSQQLESSSSFGGED